MSIKPPISIPFEFTSTSAVGFISSGPWAGFPNQWQIDLTIFPQSHSDDTTPSPFEYNGFDAKVGDWLATGAGTAVQIISITTANTTTNLLDCVVEDIELFNVNSDSTINGTGLPGAATGVIFKADDEGKPVIVPAPTALVTTFALLDIISRFQYTTSADSGFNWINANNNLDFAVPAVATSSNAIAIGNAAKALNENAISIGSSAENTGANSILIGDGLTVTEDNAIAFGNSGEIKFYINEFGDTGFGTDNPEAKIDLYTSARENYLKISNNVTGTSADSGVLIGLGTNSNNLRFVNQENADLTLETAGFERIKIDTSGYINFSHGNFNTTGDASYKFAILKASTVTSGVETWLTLPNSDELDMPDNSTWLFEADVLGKQQGGVIVGGYRHRGLITRSTGANTVIFVEDPYAELIGESVSAYGWESGVSADPSTGGLRIFGKVSAFSLPGQINWLAMVKITEINF